MEFLNATYLALFLIICIGFIIGNIKIKGISLDVSAIIFVALLFGHFGVELPDILQKIGLILFIYTIGLQAGPGFFDSFKENGKNLVTIAALVVVSAAVITFLAIQFMGIDKSIAIGLMAGALTSTPGLATAIDVTQSPLASIGYGIAYPFGVIGVILFVKLYPKIFRINLVKEEEAYEEKAHGHFEAITRCNFLVEHESVFGRTIEDLQIGSMTKGVVSRVKHKNEAFVPKKNTVLHKGDYIRVVGTEDALKRVELLIGPKSDVEISFGEEYIVQSYLVTKTALVNKTLGELNLKDNFNATITRVRRSGIDLSPRLSLKLQIGDKLMISSQKSSAKQISKLIGDNKSKLSDTDFFPLALGIVIGILVGGVSLSFGDAFTFNLGLTGGVLIVAMILGRVGKTGNMLWVMSGNSNQLLRQFGLMLFLAVVGTKAGATLVETYLQYGIKLFLIGGLITFVPMVLAAVVARMFFKINVLTLLGTLTGSMTSTPGLAAVDTMTKTDAPSVAYATVYPIAMVLLIICTQILGLIF
ncbi:TrkA C-terminal domain-containing protein [Tamlana sp. 2_MG-2023]|uniref:aspartate:alanine exchanger family transporter n=1 Tax=unclassified Tamlana TaxID=2614803 RepID=UPI0026E34559|nr:MULTISPECIES: TrkA C-terminal domain-containing protein [unclassified Tamlana]MDO6759218.1 TrkA C-terminal domain-containing protein [Tamlana sp. 2_MG-2023]MDO6790643.1 TrkA C-terminal domain-containing protein [Tamlana sp. 1_MG-2023]